MTKIVSTTSQLKTSETQQRRGLQTDPLGSGVSAGVTPGGVTTPHPLTAAELRTVCPSPSSSMQQARALVSLSRAVPGVGPLPRGVVRPRPAPRGRVETQGGIEKKIDPLPAFKTPIFELTNTVSVPALRTIPGMNTREHPLARHRRVKAEHAVVLWSLMHAFGKRRPPLPTVCRLTRCTPSAKGLDSDNLQGALKAIRDAVASWLGVDDARLDWVRYTYCQELRATWDVRIEFLPIPTLSDEVTP